MGREMGQEPFWVGTQWLQISPVGKVIQYFDNLVLPCSSTLSLVDIITMFRITWGEHKYNS